MLRQALEDDPAIELSQVTFGYGREVVLNGVDLTVHRRDFLAVVGPNGGGKTTLLMAILGLVRPWSGEVRVNLKRPAGRLGYVPQFANFDKVFPLTVTDVIKTGRLGRRGLLRRYNQEDGRAVDEITQRFGLEEVAHAPIGDLSGGQLQRTLIARALVSEPEILLLDEPLASIDAGNRRLLIETLVDHNRTMTVVVVTHHLGFLSNAVRRVVRMNRRLSEEPLVESLPACSDFGENVPAPLTPLRVSS